MRPLSLAACLIALAAPLMAQQSLLNAYDANGDGALDRAEFQVAQRDTFHGLDTNDDGLVTEAELQARGDNATNILSRDADGDGALTEAEFLSQAPGFARADKNRDGVLAGQELARLEKFMARARS